MSRRVDQVEQVRLSIRRQVVHAHGVQLDRDAPLALEFIVVQDLLSHLTPVESAGLLEQPVGQRALAMIDVSDDAEVADMVDAHGDPDRFRTFAGELEIITAGVGCINRMMRRKSTFTLTFRSAHG